MRRRDRLESKSLEKSRLPSAVLARDDVEARLKVYVAGRSVAFEVIYCKLTYVHRAA